MLSLFGNTQQALNLYIHSVNVLRDLYTRSIDKISLSGALNNLGVAYRDLGDLVKALNCINEARQIVRKLDKQAFEMIYLDNLAGIYWDKNDRDLSFKHAKEAIKMAFSVGNEIRAAEFLKRIIEMNLIENNLGEATQYLKELEKIVDHNKNEFVSQYTQFPRL